MTRQNAGFFARAIPFSGGYALAAAIAYVVGAPSAWELAVLLALPGVLAAVRRIAA